MEVGGQTRRVVVVAFDGADAQDIIGPCEVFAAANMLAVSTGVVGTPLYKIEIVSLGDELRFTTLSGVIIEAHQRWHECASPIDTLLVSGGDNTALLGFSAQISWLQGMAPQVRRLGSICTGAFLLAQAGLLHGKRVVTHWRFCEQLARSYPSVTVDPNPIFIRDGYIYTSAGITAGMDLALALVAEDAGRKLALRVARELVMFMSRPGGQAQFSVLLELQERENGDATIASSLQGWMLEHLAEDLCVERLAEQVHMSPRNFSRVFVRETGKTPARFVESLRIEIARRRLEESSAGLERVARECGFGSADSMRRSFLRVLKVVPQDYRARFHA
ncbi:HTH-type transcriptional regulator CdhR [Abditibacteriota bacterium]|nr:HTH-type transcriptional regulator CdhR [Abditibacteriota bacterium]